MSEDENKVFTGKGKIQVKVIEPAQVEVKKQNITEVKDAKITNTKQKYNTKVR